MILKAGTVIKVNGFPFTLSEDTEVIGNEENLKLVDDNEYKDVE